MARLLEDETKNLLARLEIAVPRYQTVTTASTARDCAIHLGGQCVVKALVPTGRRGKSGAVRFCKDADEVASAGGDLLGSTVGPYPVQAVLVEEHLDIQRELYVAVEIAADRPAYTLLLAAVGGVEIESEADAIVRASLDPRNLPDAGECSGFWRDVDASLPAVDLGAVTARAIQAFVQHDLTLLEVNPLAVLSDGRVVCVGALAAVDDNALARHPSLAAVAQLGTERAWRPETELEARVARITADTTQRGSARYLELDGGNIGFLCGGGGASLLLFDAIVAAGGQPANYTEFGGNPTEQRVYDLTRVVLSKPGVQGLFVAHNLTNNTQVDIVAAGVIRALRDAGLSASFPVVAREAGLNDDDARNRFESAGARYFGEETTLSRAAGEMVAAMRSVGRL
jgi:succinyl-CoA synthetase beta subunit